MKKLCTLLRIAIFCQLGVFLGSSLYTALDYRAHPGLYAMQSAPWYTGILLSAGVTAALVLVLLVLLAVLKQKTGKKEEKNGKGE